MTPDTNPIDALDTAVEPCADCTATTRWERRQLSPTSEAWLGTCETCGSMQVLALGAPDEEIEDPLGYFLLGVPKFEAARSRPAWQRFFTLTTGAPFHLKWSFETAPCETCHATATVGTRIASPAWKRALSLCLNCGHVIVETSSHMPNTTSVRLTGTRWAPPDPGVKTLRETVFETYRRWAAFQEWRRRSTGDEPDPQ